MRGIHLLFCLLVVAAFCVAETNAQSGWYIQHRDSLGPELISVHFTDALTGWTVGDGTTILHTTDGGITWYAQTNGVVGGFFESVYFVDSNTGWVAGNFNTILHTTNGGNTWETQRHSNDPVGYSSICFSDATRGWAVGWVSWVNGHFILHTTDGGYSWSEQRSGQGVLRSACFVDSLTGWVVGDMGIILCTTNGGTTWEAQTSGVTTSLYSVSFPQKSMGWTVGRSDYGRPSFILHTTNGGTTWNRQLCDSTRWLCSIYFMDVLKGWVTGYDSENAAAILHTTDGGNTWSAQPIGIRRLTIRSIDFWDSVTGWAVGDEGTILHTTNGGVTFVGEGNPTEQPMQDILSQNYPNPFNPSTTIKYQLPSQSHVTLKVYNVLGREVATLVNEVKQPGTHKVQWDADNVSSGVYLCRLTSGPFNETRRLVLLK